MTHRTDTAPVKAAVIGSLVADASGMGLHWIYSQGKIAKIVKDTGEVAEFHDPDESNYQKVPAFFAHAGKKAGDSSNYGAYFYVLIKAISAEGFDPAAYVREFQDYFGVGGEYVGYADGPMRETIFNIAKIGKEIHARVMEQESSLSPEQQEAAGHYISRYYFEYDTEGLKDQIRTPLRLNEWSREELGEADRLVDEVASSVGAIGTDDDQLPALTRSAVLAHFYEGDTLASMVERAVRITNDNDTAVAYSVFMARIMRDLYLAADSSADEQRRRLETSIESQKHLLPGASQSLIDKTLSYSELDYRGVTKEFGAACHLDMGVPVALHIALNTRSFREANHANILASGDNCGRAVLLGALAGTIYGIGGETGIPESWVEKTRMVARIAHTEGGALLLS